MTFDVSAIRAKHASDGDDAGATCTYCLDDWPCDAIRCCWEIDRLNAALARARKRVNE